MDSQTLYPENFPERIIYHAIIWTYGYYLLGGLYILAPVIGWVLLLYLLVKLYIQTPSTPASERIYIPVAIVVWIVAMLVLEIVLLIAHNQWDLSIASAIKSSIGWAKGWALLAIFPLIGCLKIRAELIYRAAAIVGKQTLIIAPIFLIAPYVGLPQDVFVSPLQIIGGPGPEFFTISLYGQGPDGSFRWRLFTPWGPALGMVGIFYFIFALQEKGKWFWYGLLGSLFMILVSKSRVAIVAVLIVPAIVYFLSRLRNPFIYFLASGVGVTIGLLYDKILLSINNLTSAFIAARAGSSRVRGTLSRIALDRWEREAPIFGHGIVEKGPHLVEYMMIGSHHTWYGLLFVKGLIGFAMLAIALLVSFIQMLIKAQNTQLGKVGLAVIVILLLYSFSENLEILAYLYWPALVILGIAHKNKGLTPNILNVRCQPLKKL